MEGTRYSHWFLIVVAVFVICLITANIVPVKLVDLFGLILPAAIFIFPLSYITGDALAEVLTHKVIFPYASGHLKLLLSSSYLIRQPEEIKPCRKKGGNT